MLVPEELKSLLEARAKVFGSDGKRIGTLSRTTRNDRTDVPQFATVRMGLLGSTERLVPLREAEVSNGNLYVRFPRDCVKRAPVIDPAGVLKPKDVQCLYGYYSRARPRNPRSKVDADPVRSAVDPGSCPEVSQSEPHSAPRQACGGRKATTPGRPIQRTDHSGP